MVRMTNRVVGFGCDCLRIAHESQAIDMAVGKRGMA